MSEYLDLILYWRFPKLLSMHSLTWTLTHFLNLDFTLVHPFELGGAVERDPLMVAGLLDELLGLGLDLGATLELGEMSEFLDLGL